VNPAILLAVALALGILVGCAIASRVAAIRIRSQERLWRERIDGRVADGIRERERELRRDAAARSGKALSGRVLERFSPLMEDFPFDPHDAVWIGHPVDFLVFDGLSLDRQEGRGIRGIVFLEVKSGSGKLSPRQRSIREAVEGGKVAWMEFRIPT
jgi:predicted Holliday junction resolvase-like endonuclease